jgi:hypothetical protein
MAESPQVQSQKSNDLPFGVAVKGSQLLSMTRQELKDTAFLLQEDISDSTDLRELRLKVLKAALTEIDLE